MRRTNSLQRLVYEVTCGTVCFWMSFALAYSQETKTKIRISYPTASICCIALFAAQQWKVFQENGLEVESIQMRSQAANAALVSGDIHYVAGVGPSSVTATLRGLPSKAVWFASDMLIYSLMARPEIKTLKELRGKRIGLTGLVARPR
jgi:ABC-type nitrate/sulfonate/bicarbonate transport system substrate-binding protein